MASKLLWNDGWEFCELELGEQNCQMPEKASWRKVDIPHDWMIYDTHNLYRNSIGWYRKKMIVEKEEPEEEIVLRFDGCTWIPLCLLTEIRQGSGNMVIPPLRWK